MKKMFLMVFSVLFIVSCSQVPVSQDLVNDASVSYSHSGSAEVEVLYAQSPDFTLAVYVEVANLAYQKKVTLFYSAGSNPWLTAEGVFVKSLPNNRELWKVVTPYLNVKYQDIAQFAVRYQVAGKTFWDNNNGNDYQFPVYQSYFGGNNYSFLGRNHVLLHRLYANYSYGLTGYVLVKNLAYTKEVKVVWSQDSWKTVNETPAVFHSAQEPGQEYWSYADSRMNPELPFEAAVSFKVNGVTYWDNNFGANYSKTSF